MATLNGEVGFEAGGKSHTLKYSVNTLIRLEDRLDMGVDELIATMQAKPRLSFLRTVFWAGLLHAEPKITEEAAGELMSEVTAGKAGGLIAEAFAAAFPQAEDGEAAADPRTEEAGTGPGSSKAGAD